MIASLRGTLIARSIDEVVVECAGVGYAAAVSLRTLERLPAVGEDAFMLVHTVVREDAFTLYGFLDAADREMFRRLTSVSGVGPKIGLAALSQYNTEDLQRAFIDADERALTRIPGVGKKTAQRMLLELSDTMRRVLPATSSQGSIIDAPANVLHDLELALTGLGYTPRDVQSALRAIQDEGAMVTDLGGLLKKALKMLQR